MRKLAVNSLFVAAIVLAATVVRDAPAADIVVPPDPSALDTTMLVSNACSKCHGAAGISISPLFPNLAGQQASYIETQLKAPSAACSQRSPCASLHVGDSPRSD